MADIKYLDKTGLTTVKSILDGLFATKGHSHSKGEIGLGNVDNTADKDKNVKYASLAGYANDSNLLDGKDSTYFDTAPFSTIRDFTLGTLIKTDINYNVTSGDPFYVEIKGNTYISPGSMHIQIQGYIYNDTIINYSVTSLGVVYPSEIIAKNVGGYLCFWFPRIAYWHGYYIKVTTGYNYSVNRVTDVLDSNEPSGTKRVVLTNTFYTNYSNNNLTISGGGSSGGSSLSIKTNSTTYSLTIPTSLPASDVYSWAKSAAKPSYNASEVGALPFFKLASGNANDLSQGLTTVTATVTNQEGSNHSAFLTITDIGTPFQLQIPDSSTNYIYKRYKSGSTWSAWTKLSAGYADTAGSAVDQTARNAAAAAQTTADGKWTYNEDTIKAVKVNNADKLDNIDSSGFFASNRGSVSVPYIDLTIYTANHSDYKNYDSGTYNVSRTGYSDTYIIFKSTGSTSAIELLSNYNDTARLKLRKTIDNNRVSGPWRELAFTSDIPTSLPANGGSSTYAARLGDANGYYTKTSLDTALAGKAASHDHPYLSISGGTMTGTPYINMPASAATISDSQPFGITYGRIQSYGTMTIAADTDGSTTEYINLTAGYGVANATAANGLSIGYNTLKWKGSSIINESHISPANGSICKLCSWPGYGTGSVLRTKGFINADYGSASFGHPDDEYLKAICKWAIDTYTNLNDITLIGSCSPNSSGTCILHLYSSSGKDSTTKLPRYCAGLYQSLSGHLYTFGTVDYVWYYRNINTWPSLTDLGGATASHTHNSIKDIGNSTTTTFAYSKAGLNYADYTWLAGWNGYELRAINKSQFAQASHSHDYLPLSGGTLTGSVTFANGTWNVVGDDAAIGDYNVAGSLGLKSVNNNIPSIGFHNSSSTLLGTLKCDAGTLKWNTNTIIDSGNIGSQSVNYAASAGAVAWNNVSGKPTLFTANGQTGTVDLNSIKTNGSYYISPNATNNPGAYGELLCMSNVDTHAQIYVPYSNGAMKFRGANDAGGYYGWRTVVDSVNISSYAITAHQSLANYVTLDGTQTISGAKTFSSIINANSGIRIGSTNDVGWYLNSNRITAGTSVARDVNVGSLLVSNAWADASKVPANGIYSKGNITVGGSVTAASGFFDNSDERLKDFYDDIDVDFNKLKSIPKKYFSWKSDESKEIHLGTSAQAIQVVYPEIVNDNEGTLTVDYSKLSVVALAAIDKLHDENQELKSKISTLEERLAKLEKLLES